ncbi:MULTISPECIES: hypothetical protein [unclassified Bacillus cereus group]|uniref:hypothetical protein n=1 Tax=unclassified Bacillus cereus group TaxID=2750818 RepID=UPI003F246BDE
MFRSDANNTDKTISICIIAIAVSLYVFFKEQSILYIMASLLFIKILIFKPITIKYLFMDILGLLLLYGLIYIILKIF